MRMVRSEMAELAVFESLSLLKKMEHFLWEVPWCWVGGETIEWQQ